MSVPTKAPNLLTIDRIRTLGPTGTNCEAAARHYAGVHKLDARIDLHKTLEEATALVLEAPNSALLGCVVYPDLHNLVFPYLTRLQLDDVFMFNTFNMVLATRHGKRDFGKVATHPAPQSLVKDDYPIILANSNSEAARLCFDGDVDACVTTLPAARALGLEVVRDFGEVPMGFTIHVHDVGGRGVQV